MKRLFIFTIITAIFMFVTTPSHAGSHGWLIYYEGSFRGKVIDAETKQPIEGAVVVAIYQINCLGFGHGGSVTVDIKETLTDKNGEFYLWPNISFSIIPWCLGGDSNFIIFKPGYGNFPNWRISPPEGTEVDFEDFFSKSFGKEKDVWWRDPSKTISTAKRKRIKVTFGLVELPKLKMREERRSNIPSLPSWKLVEKQKILIRLINEEETYLRLEKSDPFKARDFILKRR